MNTVKWGREGESERKGNFLHRRFAAVAACVPNPEGVQVSPSLTDQFRSDG